MYNYFLCEQKYVLTPTNKFTMSLKPSASKYVLRVELGGVSGAAQLDPAPPVVHHEGAEVMEELPFPACQGSLPVPELNLFDMTDH